MQCVLKVSGRGSWTRNSQRDWTTNAAVDAIVYTGGMAHLTLDSHLEEHRTKATVDAGAGASAFPENGGYGWALDSHRHVAVEFSDG